MSGEHEKRERSHLQHEAEHSRPRKKIAVVSYLAILFAAAFLLLLLTYFMQQRTSQDAISGLKDSVDSMQSVGNLVDQNKTLHTENNDLKDQADKLTAEIAALEKNTAAAQKTLLEQAQQLEAMDWFWRIQRSYSRGSKGEAKALAGEFEATGLVSHLPDISPADIDGPSPAEQYLDLLQAMGIKTAQP